MGTDGTASCRDSRGVACATIDWRQHDASTNHSGRPPATSSDGVHGNVSVTSTDRPGPLAVGL
jgi:hypothetical protein